jgi:hypothetical protein
MIFETDTNRVLVWDNAAWVMIADTDQPPGLQLITTGTLSSTATNFEGCFSSEYTNYRVVIDAVKLNGAGDIYLQYFTTGTTQPAGNNYYWAWRGITSGGGGAEITNNASAAAYLGWGSPGAGGQGGVVFDVLNPQISTSNAVLQGVSLQLGSGVYTSRSGGVAWDASTSFSGFRITTLTTVTMTGGTVRVYGYRD